MDSVVVVFPFSEASLEDVEKIGKKVMAEPNDAVGEHPGRAKAFYAGRAALGFAFEYVGLDARIKVAPGYGHLEVQDPEGRSKGEVFCNITHTENIALAAVSSGPIGIDVENIKRPVSNALRRVISDRETAAIQMGNPILQRQEIPEELALWCSKEAYAKAIGLGLGAGLNGVDIGIGNEPPFSVDSELIGPLQLEDPLVDLFTHAEYLVAMCGREELIRNGFKRLLFGIEN